jgi:lysophospholipase L1-like esterase
MKNKGIKVWLMLSALFLIVTSWTLLKSERPTIYIIGDSTVKNGKGIGDDGLFGWGNMLSMYFDTTKINIKNYARGGRSSRTFQDEGLWDSVMVKLKPGDYVLMQFGHNDGSSLNTGRARGTKPAIIHTYGWYMRKYVRDAKAKGAFPIVFSMVPRNEWVKDSVKRASKSFGKWAHDVAVEENAFFVDLNEITALKYEAMGADSVKTFFPGDHTHTSKPGAIINAESVVDGIKALKDCKLKKYLLKNK